MKASRLGILSAIIASTCCVGPLLLILVGLGSLGLGAAIGKYHWFLIAAAFGLIVFAWRSYFKEKKSCNLRGCRMEKKRMTLIPLMIASLVVAVLVGLNIYTYAVQGSEVEGEKESGASGSASVVIPVKGMTCFTCEVTVSSALNRVDGVMTVEASAREGHVKVGYDPEETNITRLVEAINKTGYQASLPGDE